MSTCTWSWSSSTGLRGALSLAAVGSNAHRTSSAWTVPCRMLYRAGSAASEAIHSFGHITRSTQAGYLLSGRLATRGVRRYLRDQLMLRKSADEAHRADPLASLLPMPPLRQQVAHAQRFRQYRRGRPLLLEHPPLGVRWCSKPRNHRPSVRQHPIESRSTRSRDRHRVST